MKKTKITLHKDGTLHIEALGIVGEGCLEHTRQLEKRLGVQVGERTLKPEYSETEAETESDFEVER